MKTTKQLLYEACKKQLHNKIEDLHATIAAINAAKQNETKSSAGDKYETGRAMMQMEEDKITARLEQAQHMRSQLQQIAVDQNTNTVRLGSLVTTDQRTYLLSVSLGKVELNREIYFCLSPDAPVGKLLLGKTVGETIIFNGKRERVERID